MAKAFKLSQTAFASTEILASGMPQQTAVLLQTDPVLEISGNMDAPSVAGALPMIMSKACGACCRPTSQIPMYYQLAAPTPCATLSAWLSGRWTLMGVVRAMPKTSAASTPAAGFTCPAGGDHWAGARHCTAGNAVVDVGSVKKYFDKNGL